MMEFDIKSSSDELYSSDEEDLQPPPMPTLADLEVSNFGLVWNAVMGWVTHETYLFCNALPLPAKPAADKSQANEFVLPPVDSLSVEAARRGTFNQLISNHLSEINAKLKLSVPIYGEFQGCVNTFLFRSTIDVETNAQWGAIALAIIASYVDS